MWWRKHPTLWVTLALVFIAFVIISSHRRDPGSLSLFERLVYAVARPFQKGLADVLSGIRETWLGYVALVEVRKENKLLTEKLKELEKELAYCREIKSANERLAALLKFQNSISFPTVATQVIGEDSSGWFRTLIIDKGAKDGIDRGMAVVAREGLVGHVVEVADRSAKVLLIIDRNSAVDVLLQKSRTKAVLEGIGKPDVCELKYVPRSETVEPGEMVITSGLGGIYPKGLLVGKVEKVSKDGYGLFQKVEVVPQVDFRRLEEVLVIVDSAEVKQREDGKRKTPASEGKKGQR